MLIMMALFLCVSQMTSGPIKSIHCHETCVDSSAGFAMFTVFCFNPIVAVISEYLVQNAGVTGMFSFFAFVTAIGFLYYVIFFKDTVYKYIEDEDG